MLEIPLDFIQSCTNLRDLHLSNMFMKRVPQSVQHATSLIRLDLSANRLSDLSEAFLDNIASLDGLDLHCNRLQNLPWYFPRMHSLAKLNVANNRLRTFPQVLFSMENLSHLDLSFNDLDELPSEISRLRFLIELKITGNRIPRLPPSLAELRHLEILDCERNRIVDVTIACELPSLTLLRAAYNSISSLRLNLGPRLNTLDVSHNDITHLSLQSSLHSPKALAELNLSHAKLSSIDDTTLGSLTSLRTLHINRNTFTSLPESLCQLRHLTRLFCSDNKLTALPESIGQLDSLKELDAHNNSLSDLPVSIWNCAKLETLNLTSNLLGNWHDPPVIRRESEVDDDARYSRKGSVVSLTPVPVLPPLAHSLKRLYLGENRLIDEVLHVLMIFKELRILNLSFNEFQDMPANFFTNLNLLEELYLSGNKLASLPTEDLPKLQHLKRLYLNGNKLQTLPQELGKVKNLTVLDVGSNLLRYNITNWEFDWNW
jgi:adenylate cyclase